MFVRKQFEKRLFGEERRKLVENIKADLREIGENVKRKDMQLFFLLIFFLCLYVTDKGHKRPIHAQNYNDIFVNCNWVDTRWQ